MARRRRAVRATGIGGVFFKARDPKGMARWYSKHLGIQIKDTVALFGWRGGKGGRVRGHTVWSIFPEDTDYFGKDGASFMINYRVKDLRRVVASLVAEGVTVAGGPEDTAYGRFAWITDPEGNRIELWEPPARYRAPEPAIPME